jgi:hypothetical protein
LDRGSRFLPSHDDHRILEFFESRCVLLDKGCLGFGRRLDNRRLERRPRSDFGQRLPGQSGNLLKVLALSARLARHLLSPLGSHTRGQKLLPLEGRESFPPRLLRSLSQRQHSHELGRSHRARLNRKAKLLFLNGDRSHRHTPTRFGETDLPLEMELGELPHGLA